MKQILIIAVLATVLVACGNDGKTRTPISQDFVAITEEGVEGIEIYSTAQQSKINGGPFKEYKLGINHLWVKDMKDREGIIMPSGNWFISCNKKNRKIYYFYTSKGSFAITVQGTICRKFYRKGIDFSGRGIIMEYAEFQEILNAAKPDKAYPTSLWLDQKYF